MSSALFYIHALSPLHMGTGAATGAIDLPHSREAATRLPNIPGSGLKGVWRDEFRAHKDQTVLFGAEWSNPERDQGALLFSDAWLLCMPVMSYVGDFAWVTSAMSLARFARERQYTLPGSTCPALPAVEAGALVGTGCTLRDNGHLYLHELKLKASESAAVQAWAELIAAEVFAGKDNEAFRSAFAQRLVVVSEDQLVHLSHVAAQVPMRNALDDNKLVKDGALWSEELMPAETLFWGSVAADAIRDRQNTLHPAADNLASFQAQAAQTRRLQMGGKASTGRGVCRFVLPATTKGAA